jgi:hypothetical protein
VANRARKESASFGVKVSVCACAQFALADSTDQNSDGEAGNRWRVSGSREFDRCDGKMLVVLCKFGR